MNYNATICALCPNFITYSELREAVYWLPELRWGLEGLFWFDDVADFKFAHRRCWKAISEKRRRNIRNCCECKYEPCSMEQRV